MAVVVQGGASMAASAIAGESEGEEGKHGEEWERSGGMCGAHRHVGAAVGTRRWPGAWPARDENAPLPSGAR